VARFAHTPLCLTPSFTTSTHHLAPHHLSHTTLSPTIFDTPSFTHNFVTHHLSPHHLSHTPSFTTPSITHTQHCHTPSFLHLLLCHSFLPRPRYNISCSLLEEVDLWGYPVLFIIEYFLKLLIWLICQFAGSCSSCTRSTPSLSCRSFKHIDSKFLKF
jgi:hypothetical protein